MSGRIKGGGKGREREGEGILYKDYVGVELRFGI